MVQKFAELNEAQDEILREYVSGMTYKKTTLGGSITFEQAKALGLFPIIIIKNTLGEYKKYGEIIITIDTDEKIVRKTFPIEDLTAKEILTLRTRIWMKKREAIVQNIEVTYNDIIYQGDEKSQDRMARAIISLNDDEATIEWTPKNNAGGNLITRVDLKAILLDAGSQQTAIWNDGRPQ